jgi:hypothetical protein
LPETPSFPVAKLSADCHTAGFQLQSASPIMNPGKPDYGIDAPGVIRKLIVIGFALYVLRASYGFSPSAP